MDKIEHKKKINDLAKSIARSADYLINEEVFRLTRTDVGEQIKGFILQFQSELNNSRALVEDFKDQGLSVSAIEAEGYLRAMLTIRSLLEEFIDCPKED